MDTKDINVRSAKVLSKAEVRRKNKDKNTAYCYAFRVDNQPFSLPFFAPSDILALDIFTKFKNDHTELANAKLFCVGSYCWLDGKITPFRKLVISEV